MEKFETNKIDKDGEILASLSENMPETWFSDDLRNLSQEVEENRSEFVLSPMMQLAVDEQYDEHGSEYNISEMWENANVDFEGNGPLIEQVYSIFLEELEQTELGHFLSEEERIRFTDICVFGQVAVESSWGNDNTGDIRGIWQINKNYYPGYEYSNPLDCTRAAIEVFNGLFLSRDARVAILDLQGEASNEEFLFPMLLLGYNRGVGTLEAAIDNYRENHPDALNEHPLAGDRFRVMTLEATEVPEGVLGRRMYNDDEGLNYVPKILAYAELMQE